MALSVASLLSAAAARLVQLEEQQQQQQGDGEVTAASVTTPWRGSLQLAVQTSQEEDVFYGHGYAPLSFFSRPSGTKHSLQ